MKWPVDKDGRLREEGGQLCGQAQPSAGGHASHARVRPKRTLAVYVATKTMTNSSNDVRSSSMGTVSPQSKSSPPRQAAVVW
eukprot:955038-Prymnesium_polylepis.2